MEAGGERQLALRCCDLPEGVPVDAEQPAQGAAQHERRPGPRLHTTTVHSAGKDSTKARPPRTLAWIGSQSMIRSVRRKRKANGTKTSMAANA